MNKQVIVSGQSVAPELAARVRHYCIENGLFAVDWCHPNGTIGYFDASNRVIESAELYSELTKLALEFPRLELGVSLMSGAPGTYTTPEVSWSVYDGKVMKHPFPHAGHKPPTRYKVDK